MKRLLLIFFLVIDFTIYGQENFSFGINFTPVYSKNIYHNISDSENWDDLIDLNEYDNWEFGWITGISLNYHYNNKLTLNGELNFKMINDIYYSDLPYYWNINGSWLALYPSREIKTHTNLNYLTIPIGIRYKILNLNNLLCLNVNPMLSTEILLNDNNSDNQFTTNHSKINFIFNIGLPIEYAFNKSFILSISPECGITINTINNIEFNNEEYCNQRNQYLGFKMELKYYQK